MYKYLPITTNLKEMMVMLKSLPAYTLVFDKSSNLVDLNDAARRLLKIDNIQEFNEKKNDVFLVHDFINVIILMLKKGHTVRYLKAQLKCFDGSFVYVELCACMINGRQDLFLFQLFELPLSANSDIGDIDNGNNQPISLTENSKIPLMLYKEDENNSTQDRKFRYRKLTKIEIAVSNLVSQEMTVSQIAYETNKSKATIHNILYRIAEKQRTNSL